MNHYVEIFSSLLPVFGCDAFYLLSLSLFYQLYLRLEVRNQMDEKTKIFCLVPWCLVFCILNILILYIIYFCLPKGEGGHQVDSLKGGGLKGR